MQFYSLSCPMIHTAERGQIASYSPTFHPDMGSGTIAWIHASMHVYMSIRPLMCVCVGVACVIACHNACCMPYE